MRCQRFSSTWHWCQSIVSQAAMANAVRRHCIRFAVKTNKKLLWDVKTDIVALVNFCTPEQFKNTLVGREGNFFEFIRLVATQSNPAMKPWQTLFGLGAHRCWFWLRNWRLKFEQNYLQNLLISKKFVVEWQWLMWRPRGCHDASGLPELGSLSNEKKKIQNHAAS